MPIEFPRKKYKIPLNSIKKCQVLVKGTRVSGTLYEDMTKADTLSDDMTTVADTLSEDLTTVAVTISEDLRVIMHAPGV